MECDDHPMQPAAALHAAPRGHPLQLTARDDIEEGPPVVPYEVRYLHDAMRLEALMQHVAALV